MTNTNPDTGIAYGYISANSLDSDLVQSLQDNGTDLHYQEARNAAEMDHENFIEQTRQEEGDIAAAQVAEFDGDKFGDDWQDDEPVHAGTYQGVNYQTSWLGGALNVWIFQSPHTTDKARRASPCVPGAGILDTLDGDVTCYNVPDDWRYNPEA
ncbi:hypothetical protein Lumi_074 [Xylophilus phage Lumi]|nr:hypothetical protein Lumi_074 [Xylophilus phage Lumi]